MEEPMTPIFALETLWIACAALAGTQSTQHATSQAPAAPRTARPLCSFVGASHPMTFVPGANTTNTFVTSADPDLRKFIVHVPSSYSAAHAPYPVVYMLHGSNQTAQIILNNTTWNHAAEEYGFIAVYPQALPYLLLDGTTQTKWHTDEVAAHAVDPSDLPMADDVVFLRELHNTLGNTLNIDCDRIYASGFSNGGAFVKTKIHVDLADIFAATTSSGGIGLGDGTASDFYPTDGFSFRPHFEVVGTLDDKKQANCVAAGDLLPGQLLPLAIANVIATPCMWDPLNLFVQALGLDPALYAAVEYPAFTQFVWDSAVLPGPGPREYRFRILPGMTHEYPSGTNYATDYVPIFYHWMSQYTR
jgi:hypothetical protein